MNEIIKVTVCVAIYNVDKYLTECLESLRKQTLKEVEFILVNDGSTDNSANICNYYSKLDSRFVVIHHEKNKGLLMTRKSGGLAARGRFLLFLDGDDYYASVDSLKDLYNHIITSGADIVRFSHQVYNNGKLSTIRINKEFINRVYSNVEALKIIFCDNELTWNFSFHIISARVVKKVFEICPNEFLICAEDAYLTFLAVHLSDRYIAKKTFPHYTYRQGSGVSTSKVTTVNLFRSIDGIKITMWLQNYFDKTADCSKYENIIISLRRRLVSLSINKLKYIRKEEYNAALLYLRTHGAVADIMRSLEKVYRNDYKALLKFSDAIYNCHNINFSHSKIIAIVCNHITNSVIINHLKILIEFGYKVILVKDSCESNFYSFIPEDVITEVIPKEYNDGRAEKLVEIINANKIDTVLYYEIPSKIVILDLVLFKLMKLRINLILQEASWSSLLPCFSLEDFELDCLKPKFYRLVDRIILSSSITKPYYQSFGCNVSILPHPLPFQVHESSLKPVNERHSIVWLGKFDEAKGKDLFTVFYSLIKTCPDFQLYIDISKFGHSILKEIKKYKFDNKIHLIESEDVIRELLLNARITFIPFNYEDFSLSLLKARLCGTAVIAYDLPFPGIIKDQSGVVLIQNKDYDELSSSIKMILEDDKYANNLMKQSRISVDEFYKKYNIGDMLNGILQIPLKEPTTPACLELNELNHIFEMQHDLLRRSICSFSKKDSYKVSYWKLFKYNLMSRIALTNKKRSSYRKKLSIM